MGDGWQPTCSIEYLHYRAQMLAAIRKFFLERAVLEVETPVLCQHSGTDPQLDFFKTEFYLSPARQTLYLQTSPEFAMKRLLAAGSGSIFQICKAFRNGETGRFHNPEFTILEWYRVDFTLDQLMLEVEDLIKILALPFMELNSARVCSYQAVFEQFTGLDPLVFSLSKYSDYVIQAGFPEAVRLCENSHELWLDFIFSHRVQPHLGNNALCMVHSYPACQSSLARLNPVDLRITDRVEIFINGVELGNGYRELTDADEQEKRFEQEIAHRKAHQLSVVAKDTRLLAALKSGLPDCSGIAIGLDRLLLILTGAENIDRILAFPVSRA